MREKTLVGTTGKVYRLMPHERWLAERFVARTEKVVSPKGLLRRIGLSATILRASATANAMFVSLFSLGLLIATYEAANRHSLSITPYIVNILIYFVLSGPFYVLQYRRRIQSVRESRAYRAGQSTDGAGDGKTDSR
jgi:hypothetical protein